MDARSRLITAWMSALLLFPLFSIPLYFSVQIAMAALDIGSGFFTLPIVLAIGGPGVLSFIVARRVLQTPVAPSLGL
jgi:hypothetical protein